MEEKYNTIQVFKKKLKIPNSKRAQSPELLALQEERDKVYQEMMDYKGKTLQLQEEKRKREIEITELMTQISKLKKDQNDKKEIIKELMSETPADTDLSLVNIEKPLSEFSTDDLLVPMSQVSLKDVEIKELKEQNEKIKSELAKMVESKNKILHDKSQLQKTFNELKERKELSI